MKNPFGGNYIEDFEKTLSARALGVLAVLLGVLLAPIQSFIWNKENSPTWILKSRPVVEAYEDVWEGALSGGNLESYYVFGRAFFLVYLLLLSAVFLMYRTSSLMRSIWTQATLLGLAMGLIGDVGAYWGGTGDFNEFQGMSFMLETLGFVVVLVGTTGFGISLIKRMAGRTGIGWLATLVSPGAIVMGVATAYFPHGPMLMVGLVWTSVSFSNAKITTEGATPNLVSTVRKNRHEAGPV
ncbi:MAG TPA: hypothetical protein VND22_02545 [Actinomycetota bacterium]|nr:hypothetical protein [Actinomycetota bacterium]